MCFSVMLFCMCIFNAVLHLEHLEYSANEASAQYVFMATWVCLFVSTQQV